MDKREGVVVYLPNALGDPWRRKLRATLEREGQQQEGPVLAVEAAQDHLAGMTFTRPLRKFNYEWVDSFFRTSVSQEK